MSKTYPGRALKQVLLRIPEEMRDRLEASAQENGRSLTAEVIARLESTFPRSETWLSKVQQSPTIKMEKRLLGLEVELEEKIEGLRASLNDHEKRIAALEQRPAAK
jgi:hypothetical protein